MIYCLSYTIDKDILPIQIRLQIQSNGGKRLTRDSLTRHEGHAAFSKVFEHGYLQHG